MERRRIGIGPNTLDAHIHIKQHTIANYSMEHGYSGLDKRSKVCHLLTGI
jgi:hypothetical protein